jgi:elongator complex protein 3
MEEKAKMERFVASFSSELGNMENPSREEAMRLKKRISRSMGFSNIPKNGNILELAENDDKIFSLLKSKPVRTLSGISVLALMTKPYPCPHGKCIFCPGGVEYNTPQSYTGFEPAARRAAMNDYDPYRQVQARLKQYNFMGLTPQKIEVIVIGGTFTTLPEDYKKDFVTQIYKSLNEFSSGRKIEGDLEAQKIFNETAQNRCVTFAIETKPERCSEKEVKQLLSFGVTRVEMGVQSVYDDILKKNNRGHTIGDVKDTTKRLRDSAFKVDHHIMLNLPFSDIDKDRETLKQVYENEELKPDAIKIYPTLVIKGTGLYKMWKRGEYSSYDLKDIVDIIAEAEINAPKWLRIMRVERDIPSNLIEGGVKMTNLRQLVFDEIRKRGRKPMDIRSREIGHVYTGGEVKIKISKETYRAAGGDEIFISCDDLVSKGLIGFLRLRIPDGSKEALVRELHVYGEQETLSSRSDSGFQHKGVGKSLLSEAERIAASEYSAGKIKIISGVGVREYYRKQGYKLENEYMVKEF